MAAQSIDSSPRMRPPRPRQQPPGWNVVVMWLPWRSHPASAQASEATSRSRWRPPRRSRATELKARSRSQNVWNQRSEAVKERPFQGREARAGRTRRDWPGPRPLGRNRPGWRDGARARATSATFGARSASSSVPSRSRPVMTARRPSARRGWTGSRAPRGYGRESRGLRIAPEASFVFRRWSGRSDSNARPPEPHSGALPSCATPRRLEG